MNDGSVQYPCLESGIKALDRAFANVCSLLIITIALIQFGRNVPCNFKGRGPYFGKTGVSGGWVTTAPSDRAFISSYTCHYEGRAKSFEPRYIRPKFLLVFIDQ